MHIHLAFVCITIAKKNQMCAIFKPVCQQGEGKCYIVMYENYTRTVFFVVNSKNIARRLRKEKLFISLSE